MARVKKARGAVVVAVMGNNEPCVRNAGAVGTRVCKAVNVNQCASVQTNACVNVCQLNRLATNRIITRTRRQQRQRELKYGKCRPGKGQQGVYARCGGRGVCVRAGVGQGREPVWGGGGGWG